MESMESAAAIGQSVVAAGASEAAEVTAAKRARTQLGLWVAAAALVLGVLGDALLRGTPWGVNVLLWTVALVAAAAWLLYRGRLSVNVPDAWLAAPLLLFAACFAWRDSTTLFALNLLALIACGALAAVYTRGGRMLLAGVTQYLLAGLLGWLSALAGWMPLLVMDVHWSHVPVGAASSRAVQVGRGILLAVPLLIVFGALFVAADAVFEGYIGWLFDWDLADLVTHAILIGALAWLSGGLLRQLALGSGRVAAVGGCPSFLTLGTVETVIVFGALNALFLAFVLVQARYLFGGAALVEASIDLTYAEYARRGFFELVAVAALALPLLLLADWTLRRESPTQVRLFRVLAALLVALLFVIMVSAVQRMRLYQQEYGLTELRLYTTAFMAWLAVVLAWFLATVLPNRRHHFASGALVSGMLAVLILNALNPDALIVRTNAARIGASPLSFDASYVSTLSDDAVPALVEVLPTLPEPARQEVAARLADRLSVPTSADWRTWNYGRWQARQVLGTSAPILEHSSEKPR